eukprot:g32675.t1
MASLQQPQYCTPTAANFQTQSYTSSTSSILHHNVFIFDNQFSIQSHRTAMGTKFAPQYANIFMHTFEQDFFAAQDLQPMLYTRSINDIFFLWTHVKNRNNLLRRQTQDMTDRVPFVIQYLVRAERLHHALHSLQHVIDNNEHLTKISALPPLLTFKATECSLPVGEHFSGQRHSASNIRIGKEENCEEDMRKLQRDIDML